MTLISDNQPSEVVQLGEKAFNLPAAVISPQLPSVLSFWLRAVAAMRRDHLNTLLFQKIIVEFVTVISFIANEFFRFFGNRPLA